MCAYLDCWLLLQQQEASARRQREVDELAAQVLEEADSEDGESSSGDDDDDDMTMTTADDRSQALELLPPEMKAIEDDTGSRTQTTLETTLMWNHMDKGVNLLSDTGGFRGPRAGKMWVGPADEHGDHDPYADPIRRGDLPAMSESDSEEDEELVQMQKTGVFDPDAFRRIQVWFLFVWWLPTPHPAVTCRPLLRFVPRRGRG